MLQEPVWSNEILMTLITTEECRERREDLETAVNNWLGQQERVKVYDVKYQQVITADGKKGEYSVMIIHTPTLPEAGISV